MIDEFIKARDKANCQRYDVEQHDMFEWEYGANWAYEWCLENPNKNYKEWNKLCNQLQEEVNQLKKALDELRGSDGVPG